VAELMREMKAALDDPDSLAVLYENRPLFGQARYRLGERIGSGSMGVVYRSLDLETGQEVALKILHEGRIHGIDLTKRFQEEAQLLKSCQHRDIVAYLGYGEDEEECYLAMELMSGTLESRVGIPQHPMIAVNWVRALCRALAHAHSLGIAHRDIRPSNLLLTKDGRLKLADFSLAQASESDGTQAKADDLRAVGKLFYHLLSTREADIGAPHLEKLNLPRSADEVWQRAVSENHSRAFQSAGEMLTVLDKVEKDLGRIRWPWRRMAAAAAAVILTAGGSWYFHKSPTSQAGPKLTKGQQQLEEHPSTKDPVQARAGLPLALPGRHYFHTTQIKGSLVGALEVTRAQFQPWVQTLSASERERLLPPMVDLDGEAGWRQTNRPWTTYCPNPEDAVSGISALAADAYCKWLTEKWRAERLIAATDIVRLPSLMELVSAHNTLTQALGERNKPKAIYKWGNHWPPSKGEGNFAGQELADDATWPKSFGHFKITDGYKRNAPVGSFTPGYRGFYDLEGNVSEWTCEPPTSWMEGAECRPTAARLAFGLNWGLDHEWQHDVTEETKRRLETWIPLDAAAYPAGLGRSTIGMRLALEIGPAGGSRFLITFLGLTDTSGLADTANPGKPVAKAKRGQTLRATWKVENHGIPGTGLLRSNARVRMGPGESPTVYTGPGAEKRAGEAVGGGINRKVDFGTAPHAYYSFDMDTGDWPTGRIDLSAVIQLEEGDQDKVMLLESSTPGGCLGRTQGGWWIHTQPLE
jgi:formylglycine-generating enzyme required for sulfatase activity